jgi:hypothetical protein
MTVDVLAVQFKLTEWAIGRVPLPDSEMVRGEFPASLVIVMFPLTLATPVGEKATFMVADWPGARITPGTVYALKPGPPDTLTLDTVTAAVPELARVTLIVLLPFMVTVPKLRFVELAVSWPAPALTETIAGLLVTLPFPFPTTTVKTVPESEAARAQVV